MNLASLRLQWIAAAAVAGTLTVSALGQDATWTGAGDGTTWSTGVVNWNDGGATVWPDLATSNAIFDNSGIGTNISVVGSLNVNNISFSGANYTIGGAGDLTFSGGSVITSATTNEINVDLHGTGGVVATGGGTLTLGGTNDFVGGMSITGGTTVSVSSSNNLGVAGISFNNGTLQATSTITDGGRNLSFAAGNGTVDVVNGGQTFTIGNLSGGNTLTVTGNGELSIAGDSTVSGFTGDITVDGGNLGVDNTNALGNVGTFTLTNNGNVNLNVASYNLSDGLTVSGTNGSVTATVDSQISGGATVTGTLTLNTQDGVTLTQSGAGIGGAGGLSIDNNTTGTTTLGVANTFGGNTDITGGTVNVNNLSAFSGGSVDLDNTDLVLGADGTLSNALTTSGASTSSIATETGSTSTNTLSGTVGLGANTTLNLIASDADDNLTVSNTITGDGTTSLGINAGTGAGTVTLSADNSATFSGDVDVNGGTLALGHEDAAGTGDININGASTIDYTVNGMNVDNNVVLAADATLNVDTGDTATESGIISGAGFGITKTGDGILQLSGANTYTGDTVVQDAGALRMLAGGDLADVTDVNVQDTATFDLNGVDQTIATLTTAVGTTTDLGGSTLTIDDQAGAGSSIAGTVSDGGVAGGVLAVENGTVTLVGDERIDNSIAVDLDNGGVTPTILDVNGNTETILTLNTEAGTEVDLSNGVTGGTLIINDTGNVFPGSTISGTVTDDGLGGTLQIQDGEVALGASDRIDDTVNVVVNNTDGESVFNLDGNNETIASLNTQANTIVSLDDGVGAAGTLTVAGPGNSVLAGRITDGGFDGGLQINGGVFQLGAGGVVDKIENTIDVGVANGATFDVNGNNEAIHQFTTAAGSSTTVGTGELTINTGGGTSNITGADAVTGTGKLIVADGTANLNTANALGSTLNVDVNNTGILDLNDNDQAIAALNTAAGTDVQLGSATLTINNAVGNDSAVNGVISGAGGGLIKNGTGILTLNNNNTYTGTTTINAGTVRLGVADAINTTNYVNQTGGTFDLNDNNQTLGEYDASAGTTDLGSATLTLNMGAGVTSQVDSLVQGTGGIALVGADDTSVLALSGNNTYSGGTTVNGGTLFIQHSNGAGSGDIQILGSVIHYDNGVNVGNNVILAADADLLVDAGEAATQTGPISGVGFGITKIGDGALTLAGTNTYTGDTIIDGGSLIVATTGDLSDLTDVSVNNTSLFDVNAASLTIQSLTVGANATTDIGANTLTLLNTGGLTSDIDGTFIGTGILMVQDGVLDLDAGATIDTGLHVDLNNAGTTMNTNGANRQFATLQTETATTTNLGAGNLTLDEVGGANQIDGAVNGSGALIVENGTVNLGNANTLQNTLSVDLNNGVGSQLNLNGDQTITSLDSAAGTVTDLNGATLGLANGGTSNIAGTVNSTGGGGEIDVISNIANFNTADILADTIDVDVQGTSTANFNGATETIDGLTVATNATAAIGGNTLTVNSDAANTDIDGTLTSTGGTLVVDDNTADIDAAATVSTALNVVQNNDSILELNNTSRTFRTLSTSADSETNVGTGTLTLDQVGGVSNISGDVNGTASFVVNNGTVNLNAADVLDPDNHSLAVDLNNSSNLNLNGNNQTVDDLDTEINTTLDLGSAQLTVDDDPAGASTSQIDGLVQGTGGSFYFDGVDAASTFILSHANTYDGGTTIAGGTLYLQDSAAAGTGTITVEGSEIQYLPGINVANTVDLQNDVDLRVDGVLADTATQSGDITQTGGTFGITKVGGGTLVLSGNNSFQGPINIEDGRLSAQSANALGGALVATYGDVNLDGGILAIDNNNFNLNNNVNLLQDGLIQYSANSVNVLNGIDTNGFVLTIENTDNADEDFNVNTAITGAGSVVIENDTEVFYNVANSYTGGTTVGTSSTLHISNAVNALNGTGDVTLNNGSVLDINVAGTYDNNVDLNGTSSTLNLDADSTFSGLFTSDDAIELLNVTGGGDLMLTGLSTGFAGDLNLNGSGTTTITAPAQFGGIDSLITNSSTSTLIVNGIAGGSVLNNGILYGTGTVAGDLLNNGSFRPGNSIGAFAVTGDFGSTASSDIQIEFDASVPGFPGNPGVAHDVINVGGDVELFDGATFNVVNTGPVVFVADGAAMNVIPAGGTVVANADQLVYNEFGFSDFLNVHGNNTGSIFQLVFDRESYDIGAVTDNEARVAHGLDYLADANPAPGTPQYELLSTLDAMGVGSDFRSALYNMSPERYDAVNTAHQRVAQRVSDATNNYMVSRRLGLPQPSMAKNGVGMMFASATDSPDMLAMALDTQERQQLAKEGNIPGTKLSVWAQGFYLYAGENSVGGDQRTGFSSNTGGGQVGVDYWITDNLLAGVAFTFTGTHVDFDGAGGDSDIYGYRVGPYLSWEPLERLWVDFSATYALNTIDVNRTVAIAGLPTQTASANYLGHDINVYLGAEYDVLPQPEWYVAPLIGMNYLWFYQDAFTESGAGGANLSVDSQNTNSLDLRVGGRFAWIGQFSDDIAIIPEFMVAYRRELLAQQNSGIGASFVGAAGGFNIPRGPVDDNGIEIGAGVNVMIGRNWSIFANYNGVFYGSSTNHLASAGLSFRF